MLDRSEIRPDRYYWVIKRKDKAASPTLAFMEGELPSLNMRGLDKPAYTMHSPADYDFLGEADLHKLFEATFLGTTVKELLATPIVARIAD